MDTRQKIAEIIKTVATQAVMICPATPDEDYYADQIMSLLKAEGWKSSEEVFNQTMQAKKSGWDECFEWHKAEGWVQLNEDQSPPEVPCPDVGIFASACEAGHKLGSKRSIEGMLKAGFKKVKG
uniref:Uncharacterized protein n=1 Tax=viral metagenome TaxID=1070528 RepID=A0A6M3J481_9ZZZZ